MAGTPIENANATSDIPKNTEICDRSGFRAKVGQLVPTWDNKMVLPRFNEPRNMQDFVKGKAEHQSGAIRPEPIGNERMIDVEFPNGVTASDL